MQIGGFQLVSCVAIIVAVALLASIAISRSKFYGLLIEREIASNRFHAIDGLRGYLALGVLLHHLVINQQFYRFGFWKLTPSRFDTFLGRGSVAFFFMITAFLFWGRVIENQGRIDALKFYVSRIRRLVPMYLVSAGLLVATVLALTHFRIVVPMSDLISQVTSWFLFTIPGVPEINAFKQTNLINTVFWSLVFEWKFYIVLPFVAALSLGRWVWLVAFGAAVSITLFSATQVEWYFLGGCIAAYVVRVRALQSRMVGPIGTVIALSCIGATVMYQPMTYTPIGALLLFFPFVIFAAGNTLFGLLTCRPARLLGLLSYSIYLLHNWVLYLVFRLINHNVPVADLTLMQYGAAACIVALLVVVLSAVTYRFVEHPAIHSSKEAGTRTVGSFAS